MNVHTMTGVKMQHMATVMVIAAIRLHLTRTLAIKDV